MCDLMIKMNGNSNLTVSFINQNGGDIFDKTPHLVNMDRGSNTLN